MKRLRKKEGDLINRILSRDTRPAGCIDTDKLIKI